MIRVQAFPAIAAAAVALFICCPSPSFSEGIGPPFFALEAIAVEASGDLVVTDFGFTVDAVIRVDPVTGDRTIVSDAGTGAGPAFSFPRGIAVEASGDLVVTDRTLDALIRVDPVKGDRTIVSDAGTGGGPVFSEPNRVAVEANGDLVVADTGLNAVVRVDPVTGDRTIVSGAGTGAGPAFSSPVDIAVEAGGNLVVIDFPVALIRLDPVTGDRTIVSGAGTGAGPAFSNLQGIAVEASGELVVTDFDLDAVIRVDPVTGDRTIVSDAGTGAGPAFSPPRDIAVEASGDLVVTDTGLDGVVRVEPVTGNRAIVSAPLECRASAKPACTTGFAQGKLTVIEKVFGKEKLTAKFLKGPAVGLADLGDPTAVDNNAFALCLYDDTGARVASLVVDRAGEDCGTKPCWKAIGGAALKGYVYTDKDASSSGVRKMKFKGGDAGKSTLFVKAANNTAKGHTSLPTGIAEALTAASSVQLQIIADNGACYETTLTDIVKQETNRFKAR